MALDFGGSNQQLQKYDDGNLLWWEDNPTIGGHSITYLQWGIQVYDGKEDIAYLCQLQAQSPMTEGQGRTWPEL